MVFITKEFFEVAIKSWPEWDLNPRPLNSVYIYIYIYIYIYNGFLAAGGLWRPGPEFVHCWCLEPTECLTSTRLGA